MLRRVETSVYMRHLTVMERIVIWCWSISFFSGGVARCCISVATHCRLPPVVVSYNPNWHPYIPQLTPATFYCSELWHLRVGRRTPAIGSFKPRKFRVGLDRFVRHHLHPSPV
ncbi:hypothetical protein BGW80DRAFT_500989 [Lactifluus volemus]|nr:hypothetical protein BGW80DRAFT_500989 [Lactifluus volemus]